MLAEFGAVGALIAGYLVFKQLGMVFGRGDNETPNTVFGIAEGVFVYALPLQSVLRFLL